MTEPQNFDVAIIGGSYAGLSAAMTLGRAIRNVVIIDSGKPCNRQTPHSHNFITQDGKTPAEISALAREQVLAYPTVRMQAGLVTHVSGQNGAFNVVMEDGQSLQAQKLIFATGIRDMLPEIPGFGECWGISAVHCPYCHGYEYKGALTGILSNDETALDYVRLIRNWTEAITLYTNGPATFDSEIRARILATGAYIVETEIASLDHQNGYLKNLHLKDGTTHQITALYHRPPFEQHTDIPARLGCAHTPQGRIEVDAFQKTSVPGIYAAGDNTTMFRVLTGAIAAGTIAGAQINHELINGQY